MIRVIYSVGLVALMASGVLAQSQPVARPKFDAVSIKVSQPPLDSVYSHNEAKRLDYHNVTLQDCLSAAYGLDARQIVGPDWLGTDRYTIVAVTATEVSTAELMLMLQSALEDRFHLTSHHEQRNRQVYALAIGDHGTKLRVAAPDSTRVIRPTSEPGNGFLFTHVSIPDFVKFLCSRMIRLDRLVINATELEGSFDFTLKWTADAIGSSSSPTESLSPSAPAPDSPPIFQAVQEQLGLRLVPKTMPLDMLVLDHANKVPTEN